MMSVQSSKTLNIENELLKIRGEHHMAEQVQRSMLPDNAEQLMKCFPVEIFADMDTAWEIGGDFYDYMALDDNHLFFAISDISGKSISAALFSEVTRTALEILLLNGNKPSAACEQISRYLYKRQHSKSHMFATLWMGILDTNNGKCYYINAGHEPPLLLRNDGSVMFVENLSGLPLGAYYSDKKPEKNKYIPFECELSYGDAILLYTDGVIESTNRLGERLGRERLIEMAHTCRANTQSIKEWISYIQRNVIRHINHAEQDDDITLLGIRYLKSTRV